MIRTRYTYEPFGSVSTFEDVSGNTSQFTGRDNDGTGLYYYRARYYDPRLQRFISEDPTGFDGGDVNLHAYLGNNPTRYRDPFGLTKITFDPKAGTVTVDPEMKGKAPYTIPATSGRPNCKCTEADRDRGPIPRGEYTLDTNQLTNPGRVGDVIRNYTQGDWGDWRVPLIPDPKTKTYGRSGFFLHGGRYPGSAGCIDVGGGVFGSDMTDRLLRDILADPDRRVQVTVK